MYDKHVRDLYEESDEPDNPTDAITWDKILDHWDAVEVDFHRYYGVDFGTGILWERRWKWFEKRTLNLIGYRGALARELGLLERTDRDAKGATVGAE